MIKPKTFAAAASGAAVFGAFVLLGAVTASAARRSCAGARHGKLYESYGRYSLAAYYYGEAEGIVDGC